MEKAGNAEKVRAALLDALRAALATDTETLLFRSGKLPGLFPMRTAIANAAADLARSEQLLDVVRREEKGRLVLEWVRISPAGVEYLYRHESPRAVLGELRDALAVSRTGVPVWLDEVRQELTTIGAKLATEVELLTRKLDGLAKRVDDALRRADAAGPGWPEGVADAVPWSVAALAYLDKRRESGLSGHCPLPELFSAVRRREPGLSLVDYHEGLKTLAAYKAVLLLPFDGPAYALPEPEYALPEGEGFLYYAAR